MFVSAVKLGFLTCRLMESDSLSESAPSGRLRNCSFWHLDFGFFFFFLALKVFYFTLYFKLLFLQNDCLFMMSDR